MYDQAFGRLIEATYEASLASGGWSVLVPELEKQLRARVAFFVQTDSGVSTIAACGPSDPQMVRRYETSLWREDRAMQKLRSAPTSRIVLDSELITDRERARSAFYNDYLAAVDAHRGIYAAVTREGGSMFVVSAQRSGSIGDYGQSETELLGRLLPHLSRSFRIWRRLRAVEQSETISSSAGAGTEEHSFDYSFGLTPAESRLLSALVGGERLGPYARRTGISVTTAKSHLGALFDKVGERRQADLIRRAISEQRHWEYAVS